ncbi:MULTISPECIES: hypothetical protein [unclassified Micromonospora]|uniref:hypothetical protein n=1 Tax=unclassified Micromonospora TaxID=2617518 RepID=UPI001034061A|nr:MULTISPECIES: hypothetical protein [unclassified Micromonospora]QKW16423.1 hypothetical protein HUT12_29195 [Verrucosispora sp. NA02020]TBL31902.1 hypothetical protein EYA84_20385 [Verrucosispora sp. SN26_14.1]
MWVRTRAVVTGFVVLVLIAAIGIVLGLRQVGEQLRLPFAGRACTVQADGEVTLDSQQMANAATIAAIGAQREMPERAVVVALATAYQESGLRNLAGGDRDSVGLFQQRPSQGWGTPEQIGDPRYAARKFYAALKKVRGWEDMRVTDAAQKVQRSAFPEAYEKWADESEVLTRALLGDATTAVTCTVGGDPVLRGAAAIAKLAEGLTLDWGLSDFVESPAGLTTSADGERAGWRYAHWMVSHAKEHGVKRVTFDGREWTAKRGTWKQLPEREREDSQVSAEVHADV